MGECGKAVWKERAKEVNEARCKEQEKSLGCMAAPDDNLSTPQLRRLGSGQLSNSVDRFRSSPAWSSGLAMDSYDCSLKPELIDEASVDDDIKDTVLGYFAGGEDIIKNPKEKTSHEVMCCQKHGGLCKKDFSISCYSHWGEIYMWGLGGGVP